MAEENRQDNADTDNAPPAWYTEPPAWYKNQPLQQPPPQQQPQNTGGNTADAGAVLTAIAAMPEKIVHAVREGIPAPQRNAQQPSGESNNSGQSQKPPESQQQSAEGKPGAKRSFGHWWFDL